MCRANSAPPSRSLTHIRTSSGKALRTDATRYRVFCYLAAFRMEELGVAGFR